MVYNKLPDNFPKSLLNKGYDLIELGIYGMAWNRNEALRVIDFLIDNRYAILGGDVYRLNELQIEFTYDSWYFNKKYDEKFLEKSKQKAYNYINSYAYKNGEDFIYSIVFENMGKHKKKHYESN